MSHKTYILSWSDNFTYRQVLTIIQENTYKEFYNSSNYTWDNISIGNQTIWLHDNLH